MSAIATAEDIARLFGRAAFGATIADFNRWVGKPYDQAVDALLRGPNTLLPPLDEIERLLLSLSPEGHLPAIQRWWLERMRTTEHPLQERLTLLWHNHFATAMLGDITPTLLLQQNQRIRQHALGSFRHLAAAMVVDPAMLRWLDGVSNAVDSVNENLGRELLELFTLGVQPQVFTEADVREAARVLTGWVVDGRNARFVPARHDNGVKRVLGRTIRAAGEQEYQELVGAALAQPIAARFVAWKLVAGLAYVPESADLSRPDPLVAKVANALQAGDWQIAPALRTLFLAPEFRSGASEGRQYVRQPVDAVVASAKALKIRLGGDTPLLALRRMGQVLFQPASIAGWPGGRAWLTATSMMARYDWGLFAYRMSREQHTGPLPSLADLAGWRSRFGLASLSGNTQEALRSVTRASRLSLADRQAGLVALLVSSPDWMVL